VIRTTVVLAALCATASADDVPLPQTKAKLAVTDGWHAVPTTGVVAAYRSDHGAILAVTRAAVPNPDAWRSRTRAAYIDQVERGIAEHVSGYRRLSRKVSEVHDVPTLDVEARRDGGSTLVVRVLLFRSYALSLAIEVPPDGDVGDARRIAAGFGP
jgi:hypothetical protein